MRAFLAALAIALLLAGGSAALLRADHTPAYQAYSTPGARITDPGQNLVGGGWYGGG